MKFLGIVPCSNQKQYTALNVVSGCAVLTAGLIINPVLTFAVSAGFNTAKEALNLSKANKNKVKREQQRKQREDQIYQDYWVGKSI